MNQNDTIAVFIRDVKQILAADSNQGTDLEQVAERMRKLVADPIIRNWQEEPTGNVHEGQQSEQLRQANHDSTSILHKAWHILPSAARGGYKLSRLVSVSLLRG